MNTLNGVGGDGVLCALIFLSREREDSPIQLVNILSSNVVFFDGPLALLIRQSQAMAAKRQPILILDTSRRPSDPLNGSLRSLLSYRKGYHRRSTVEKSWSFIDDYDYLLLVVRENGH
jgi:hypothetical protein